MKKAATYRLTAAALDLLDHMAKAMGLSHTAMLEVLIRDAARQRGIHADADSGVQVQDQSTATRRDR
jgi:Ribbon-helix-helix protein, copG family